jgi:hypothetical protein
MDADVNGGDVNPTTVLNRPGVADAGLVRVMLVCADTDMATNRMKNGVNSRCIEYKWLSVLNLGMVQVGKHPLPVHPAQGIGEGIFVGAGFAAIECDGRNSADARCNG